MPGTRASARLSGGSPELKGLEKTADDTTGKKRKASVTSSPPAKQQKKEAPEKKKKKPEAEDATSGDEGGAVKDVEMKDTSKADNEPKEDTQDPKQTSLDLFVKPDEPVAKSEKKTSEEETPAEPQKEEENLEEAKDELVDEAEKEEQSKPQKTKEKSEDSKDDTTEEPKEKPSEDDSKESNSNHEKEDPEGKTKQPSTDSGPAVEESSQRAKSVPSTILEKGIIYFFMRARIGMEDPDSVSELQRTFFVLRPLPKGAKLNEGALEDSSNNRLFALPKKTFPTRQSEKFMAFVEKANTSLKELKENFFKGESHDTKTQGTRVTPPVSPIGEGVYAITQNEGSSHLVYMLTIPSEPDEVQKDLGIHSRGSFVFSVKNPERPGPASTRLPQGPEFPKEILEEFRGLAWVPAQPKYLDYANVQVLLIGEGQDGNLGGAVEPSKKDEKAGKKEPLEELEKLEHEDELRVQHLNGEDSVYDDLHISKKEYPSLGTTW